MIYVSDIIDRLNSALDAEGSERYLFEQDFKPAINYSVEWLVSLFNSAFAANKLSEESLRELTRVGVWQTSQYSRVSFDPIEVGNRLWSIFGVMVDIETVLDGALPTAPSASQSVYVPNASFLSAEYIADRLTIEEKITNKDNPFSAGNSFVLCAGIRQYGYINFSDYTGGYNSIKRIQVKATSLTATKSFILDDGSTWDTITTDDDDSYSDIADAWKLQIIGTDIEVSVVKNSDDTLTISGNDPSYRITVLPVNNSTYLELIDNKAEIELIPEIEQELIAISYLKTPNKVTGDEAGIQAIEFPEVLMDMMTNKALQFISYKQGDATNLYGITQEDTKQLITLMS